MAPFMDRCFSPSWFRNMSHGVTLLAATTSNSVWVTFLTSTLHSTQVEIVSDGFGFIGYQANLVARNFGFRQMLPSSLYSWENDIYWS